MKKYLGLIFILFASFSIGQVSQTIKSSTGLIDLQQSSVYVATNTINVINGNMTNCGGKTRKMRKYNMRSKNKAGEESLFLPIFVEVRDDKDVADTIGDIK